MMALPTLVVWMPEDFSVPVFEFWTGSPILVTSWYFEIFDSITDCIFWFLKKEPFFDNVGD